MKKNTKVNKITKEQKEIIYLLMDFFMSRNPKEHPAIDCGEIIKELDVVWKLNNECVKSTLNYVDDKLKKLMGE